MGMDMWGDGMKEVWLFTAKWCVPCQQFKPVLKRALESFNGIKYREIDVDAEKELADQFGIASIPTLVFFKNGEPVDMLVGACSYRTVLNWLKRNVWR